MIESLQLFITLAERLHFRKTSEQHHLTPAALTRSIQALEKELGVQLFDRNNRTVVLTEAGTRFYAYAKDAVQAYEKLMAELHVSHPKALKGSVKLYATVTAAYSFLPNLIKTFRFDYPQVTTYLETGPARAGFSRVLSGESDFCIGIITPTWSSELKCKKILQTPLVFIVPKAVKKNHIKELSLILPEQGELSSVISTYFETKKQTVSVHSYVEGHEAILAMVAAGLGAAVLPQIVIENSHLKEFVSTVTLQDLPHLEVGVFVKKSSLQSPVKRAFWEAIRNK